MDFKRFDNRASLSDAFSRGINLFLGAGFSVYAKNSTGEKLPTGNQLLLELNQKFSKNFKDLPRLCTILEKTDKDNFRTYLTSRFKVNYFPTFYENLNLLNIKSIYTTNIDNLVPQIVAKSKNKYIHYQQLYGDCTDDKGINFLSLHGNVDIPNSEYIFDVSSLANIYSDAQRVWSFLSCAIEKYPTLFWGYSFEDSSVIQALTSQRTFSNAQKEKWIILYDPKDDEIEFYQTIGFSIIIGETKNILSALSEIIPQEKLLPNKVQPQLTRLLSNNMVPKDTRNLLLRPINEYFRGQAPNWGDILSNNIYKTSYYKKIQNSLYSTDKHTLIVGVPVSGKSTLAMQVVFGIQFDGLKLVFSELTENRADYIYKLIGKQHALILVENFTDEVNAFLKLSELPNVKMLGVDRSHNYETVNHLFDDTLFEIINVTELSDDDIQGVYNSLPVDIKSYSVKKERKELDKYKQDSIYEFVIRNIKGQNIKHRYKEVIEQLEHSSHDLAEFLVLCAYMHSSRVPLSIEVAYSYFSDKYSYSEVYDMREQLGDLLKDYHSDELIDNMDMDYYYPRSQYVAESIIESASKSILQEVMNNVIDYVPTIQICNFNTFQKYAFDKNLVFKAFTEWNRGKEFYEKAFIYNYNNPYVLQQGALYLSAKKKYKEAFIWIDKAITMTNNKYFSIRNSHAVIMFDANYDVRNIDAENQLDKSMEILHKCFRDDKRKTFHAITYTDQAIKYFIRVNNDKSLEYLKQALEWLQSEYSIKQWNYELLNRIKRIKNILDDIR